ncbi:hypothetical protein [Paucisalibacillus globulus]|uniref:hypothetical protein n=1 Tax=Paucisalibacillus globulus TaxID=351095 RepID=UPI00047EB466|nr:hypothetical protein [Paucisalibacillus globulus]
MSKPLLGTCDKCKKVTPIKFEIKHHPRSIQETYFKCKQCGEHYTCFVTDDWVRKRQKKMVHMRQNFKGRKILEDMQQEINERMDKLKSELLSNA